MATKVSVDSTSMSGPGGGTFPYQIDMMMGKATASEIHTWAVTI